jgi:hypothetical protein
VWIWVTPSMWLFFPPDSVAPAKVAHTNFSIKHLTILRSWPEGQQSMISWQ